MATTTNYGWTTPDDTALVKDGAAAIRTLGSSVDTTTKNLNPETTLADLAYRSSTANVKTRLGIGTTGQVLTVAAGVPSWATPTAPSIQTATFADEKTSGTNGGTFTSGAWRTRDLNTSVNNTITGASLSSNQITLPAGTYLIHAFPVVNSVNRNQARFQNITDSTTTLTGNSQYNDSTNPIQTNAIVQGGFTIASQKVFELQHQAQSTVASVGFGYPGSFGTEVFAAITIIKVA